MSVEGTVVLSLACVVVALILILATRLYSLSRNQRHYIDEIHRFDAEHPVKAQQPLTHIVAADGQRPKPNGDLALGVDELREILELQLREQEARIQKLENRLSYQKGALTKVRNELRQRVAETPPPKHGSSRTRAKGKAAGAGES